MQHTDTPQSSSFNHLPQLRRICFAAALCCQLLGGSMNDARAVTPAPVMLANIYQPGFALDDYWVSEKYDGVRGYWDGQRLLTRGGEVIQAPAWFTAGWPAQAIDGELWAGRGRFSQALSAVRRQIPQEAAWREIRFMVFDLPRHGGTFDQRLPALQALVAKMGVPWVQAVAQRKIASHADLQVLLDQVVGQGAEGLILHRGSSCYRAERNNDFLKFKPYDDAEAEVIAHLPGTGKYVGMVGALMVEMPNGLRFKIGSGLSDALRRQPPPVGSVVTYRYRGLTDRGLPRFAVFLRMFED